MNAFNDDEIEHIKHGKNTLMKYFEPRFGELPIDIRRLLRNSGILTGGASSSVFLNEIPNDYDVYLTKEDDIEAFKKMISRNEVLDKIKDVNPNYSVAVEVEGKLVTSNAVTFKNNVQVITCQVADARKHFDYLHCMPYLDIADWKYYISKDQYTCIKNKVLKINPNATRVEEHRTVKFLERGWKKI